MLSTMRKGFTLIEMLVVMILLALLVGVLFPVIVQQLDDAEPAKAANDMVNLRTGLELFQINVRPAAWPSDLSQLVVEITDSDTYFTASTSVSTFKSGHVGRWNGPYIDKTVTVTSGDAFTTGFGGQVQSDFAAYDATNDCTLAGGGNCSDYSSANPNYLAVKILGLDQDEAESIDGLIDGTVDLMDGQFRWHNNVATSTDVGYYLAVPLR